MSANGMAGIYFLKPNTTMNSAKYAELLRDKLPTLMAIHQSLIFMRDGAPCHKSKIVKQCFTKNYIKILDWPGNSPGLSPIENLWTEMKDLGLQKRPGSCSELVKGIKQMRVKEIAEEYCESLI